MRRWRLGSSEGIWGRNWEPLCQQLNGLERCAVSGFRQTHLSLGASPAFLLVMETLPSSKLHEDAAWTAPAARRRKEEMPEKRILSGLMRG